MGDGKVHGREGGILGRGDFRIHCGHPGVGGQGVNSVQDRQQVAAVCRWRQGVQGVAN